MPSAEYMRKYRKNMTEKQKEREKKTKRIWRINKRIKKIKNDLIELLDERETLKKEIGK